MREARIIQPALEVLYPNRMFDLGRPNFNHDRRLPMTDVIDPIIIPENSQGLSNRFVDTGGTNFNRMFNWRCPFRCWN